MHDVKDEKSERKRRDRERFDWLLNVLGDQHALTKGAVVYASWIMQDKHLKLSKQGYAEPSIRDAVKWLRMSRSSVIRARERLVKRGWLIPVPGASAHATARYLLGDGPTVVSLLRMSARMTPQGVSPLTPQS
jgi:hypothetical protein